MLQKYFSQNILVTWVMIGLLLLGGNLGYSILSALIFRTHFAMAANAEKENTAGIEVEVEEVNEAQSQDVIVKSINPILGELVYTTFVLGEYSSPLTIHTYTVGKSQTSVVPSVISNIMYRIKPKDNDKTSIVYDPQISPDEKYVLFQYGQGYEMSPYTMFVLDLQNNHLLKLKPHPRYTEVHWSPDSNFIAYVMGGTQNGNPNGFNGYYGPLVLHVLNWRTGEDHAVVSSDAVSHSFNWIAPNTLIYGTLPNDEFYKGAGKQLTPRANDVSTENKLPSVYAYSIQTHRSTLLFKSGYRPVASPDGRRIAYYGVEVPEDSISLSGFWPALPSGLSLMVSNRDGSQRKAMSLARDYEDLLWEQDNQHLLALQQLTKKTVQIIEWDTFTGHFKKFTFDVKNDNSDQFPQFRLRGLSADGNTAFVAGKEFIDGAKTFEYVKAINLNSGKVYTVISIEAVGKGNGHGIGIAMDWRYGSSE